MVDVVDMATRSRMMSGIRGSNTLPERRLRSALHSRGLRFRLHARDLPGKPDIVFPRYRTVVFVHGCFWHRHKNCKYATTPATRQEFWSAKFDGNVARDRRNLAALKKAGWNAIVIWECDIKADVEVAASRVAKSLGKVPTRLR